MIPRHRLSKPILPTLRGQLNWTGPVANNSESIAVKSTLYYRRPASISVLAGGGGGVGLVGLGASWEERVGGFGVGCRGAVRPDLDNQRAENSSLDFNVEQLGYSRRPGCEAV